MKTINIKNYQSGAVSLFVVIFAMLLITVVTISFLRLMVNDQSQASNSDLSQSAYDSAQAGVEDAKRVLLRYQTICSTQGSAACDQLATQINAADCNAALRIGGVIGADAENGSNGSKTGEILVQQTVGDKQLDQAYTCVTIKMLTDDYVGTIAKGGSKLVPLIGKNGDGSTDFDTVKIEWFSTEDIGKSASGTYALSYAPVADGQPLLASSSWPTNRPGILRTQLMQFGPNSTLSSFDSTTSSGGVTESNTNTLFLYPTLAAASPSQSFTAKDQRKPNAASDAPADQKSDTPLPVTCKSNLSEGGYACELSLTLPQPVGGGARTAFLRISSYYNDSHFRVSLKKNNLTTSFNAVQPVIDSTGRANTLFRRVADRVDLIDTSFPYPDAGVDVTGNLCKDFAVTDTAYIAGASCTP